MGSSRSDRKASGLVTGGEWGNGVIYYSVTLSSYLKALPRASREQSILLLGRDRVLPLNRLSECKVM